MNSEELIDRGFRLQFITNGKDVRDTVAEAEAVSRGGCRWIQLRMKEASRGEIINAGRQLRKLADRIGATLILDDYVELVDIVGADGVHLGKNDMSTDDARRILGPGKIIGATANTFEDMRLAAERCADYVGLGPFRFTTTKKNLSPVLGLDGYASILSECRQKGISLPVVAIGGIVARDIPGILSTGADGIAVSGAILNAIHPEEETAIWLDKINNSVKQS